ncbi:fimbrial protein [Serratia ureilytica]|uniref:fimbrial protein n=1 Tax=Serratia TaxID=613 RepID=UPI0018680E9C|nr:fimbrial protein [Serratia ureilytica]ELI8814454.1 fimbrial protein [Serratia marcescens]ELI8844709.1 fimbrial protein [Serratia marcescens]MBO1811566.1 fimbrial protein [Serratia ureilytica]UMK53606.1 fimbrial protein [Serratia ureilytica]
MNMRKTLLAVATPLVLMSSLSSFTALAAEGTPPVSVTVKGGTIKFAGKMVDAPCAVDMPADGQITDLGQYRVASLSKEPGATSVGKNFNIKLVDCSVDTMKNVQVKFSGSPAKGSNTTLALDGGSNAAQNVGIQILRNGEPVVVDGSGKTASIALEKGENNLAFQAQFISLSKDVKPGAANGSVDFYLTYL